MQLRINEYGVPRLFPEQFADVRTQAQHGNGLVGLFCCQAGLPQQRRGNPHLVPADFSDKQPCCLQVRNIITVTNAVKNAKSIKIEKENIMSSSVLMTSIARQATGATAIAAAAARWPAVLRGNR